MGLIATAGGRQWITKKYGKHMFAYVRYAHCDASTRIRPPPPGIRNCRTKLSHRRRSLYTKKVKEAWNTDCKELVSAAKTIRFGKVPKKGSSAHAFIRAYAQDALSAEVLAL